MTKNDVDYLLIGHVTEDLQEDGSFTLGGTVTYSGLTAKALGHQVAIITSCSDETPLEALEGIQIQRIHSCHATRFRNISDATGRLQYLYSQANKITLDNMKEDWANPSIVHIAPVFNDVEPQLLAKFPNSFRCLTPQGWMRDLDEHGVVHPKKLENIDKWLSYAHAVVLSQEDLQGDLFEAEKLASDVPVLVVTNSDKGALVFSKGEKRQFSAPSVNLIEDTGSGDIFAACFFHYLFQHQNAWQAAHFAINLASLSVTRKNLNSIPNNIEIQKARQKALEMNIYG